MAQVLPAAPETVRPVRSRAGWAGAAIVAAVIAVYWPSLRGAFIWNDSDYVTAPGLRSLGGLVRIWLQPGATQQYYPLIHTIFWLQHGIWGDDPLGYHAVTILGHAGCALLFAAVLRRLWRDTPALSGAEWIAALVFALHPVHVASVAWIAEQKNTLSLALYLASVWFYLDFDEKRDRRAYLVALVLFLLSVWAKTMTATLPAALGVVLWWKRGKLRWRQDLVPLLPWLALGAAFGLFSGWVERHYLGAVGPEFQLSPAGRVLVAGRVIWFYLGHLAWPAGLNFIYGRWKIDPGDGWQWLYPLGAFALAAALWRLRRRARAPLAAYLFFAGSLFPALGFVTLYATRYSWVWDHWQYLPDLGPIALAAAGLTLAWGRLPPRARRWGPAAAGAFALLLGGLSWRHVRVFRDDETLFRATLALNPDCPMAYNNLAVIYSHRPGGLPEAIRSVRMALQLWPGFPEAHYNLADFLARLPGRQAEAVANYEEAIRLQPLYAEAHYNLANLLSRLGRPTEAEFHYGEALRLKPDYAEAHNNLANLLALQPGRAAEAEAHYRETLRLRPDLAVTHYNLARLLSAQPGREREAEEQYREALRLRPGLAQAHDELGLLLARQGRLEEARQEWEAALRVDPGLESARRNLEGTMGP